MNAQNKVVPHFHQLEPSTSAESSSSTWEIDSEIIRVPIDSNQTDSVLGNAMRTLIDLDGCAGLEELACPNKVQMITKKKNRGSGEKSYTCRLNS